MSEPAPIPEPSWFWRRIYVYAATVAFAAHVYWTSMRTTDPATLRMVIRNDQGLIVLFALLYVAGASTEAIARVIAAVRTHRTESVTETTKDPT